MAGGKRERGRELADVLATYLLPAGALTSPLPYEQYVGLVLNLDRLRLQRAVSVALGVQAALSDGDLDASWGDAVATDPSEAGPLTSQANDRRFESRRRRRRLGGPP